MVHSRPPTPIHIKNNIVVIIVNNTIKRQIPRAMEMGLFWLLDGEVQKQFTFHYHPGQKNLGDDHTKAFDRKDTIRARSVYVHHKTSPQQLVRALIPNTRQGFLEKNSGSLHT